MRFLITEASMKQKLKVDEAEAEVERDSPTM
jgi:hypothetical protein